MWYLWNGICIQLGPDWLATNGIHGLLCFVETNNLDKIYDIGIYKMVLNR